MGAAQPPQHSATVRFAYLITREVGFTFVGLFLLVLFSSSIASAQQFAYVPNTGSNDITAYIVNETTGSLAPVVGSPFATGAIPRAVAVDPTGKYAYVANDTSGTVSAY